MKRRHLTSSQRAAIALGVEAVLSEQAKERQGERNDIVEIFPQYYMGRASQQAAEIYSKRQKLGEEAIYYATSIKVEALAQLGRMLKETPRNTGAAGIDLRAVPKENRPKAPEPLVAVKKFRWFRIGTA